MGIVSWGRGYFLYVTVTDAENGKDEQVLVKAGPPIRSGSIILWKNPSFTELIGFSETPLSE